MDKQWGAGGPQAPITCKQRRQVLRSEDFLLREAAAQVAEALLSGVSALNVTHNRVLGAVLLEKILV